MLTPRENFIRFFRNQDYEWKPCIEDQKSFRPVFVPGNVSRGKVMQQETYIGEYGGPDFFGVEWVYEPEVGGSIEKAHLFEDIEEWKDHVVFPDLDKMDWESCAKENSQFLSTEKLLCTTIYSGLFERLISFVGFENALIALVDEDQCEAVKELFDTLSDFYIGLIERMHRYFNIDLFVFHDDWGTQRGSMFSKETHEEVIVPFLSRIVQAAHKEDAFIELHSCGNIEQLFPNVISTHVDTWRGQYGANDKHMLVDTYESFKFGVEILSDAPVNDAAAMEILDKAYREWEGKKVWFNFGNTFSPEQKTMMTKAIRGRGIA